MTENFLLENPLQLFEDFKHIPDEAFKDQYNRQELFSVVNSVVESEDYVRVLTYLYNNNPEDIKSKLLEFEKELVNARSGKYFDDKAGIVEYFMVKMIEILNEIITYNGSFKKIPIKVVKLDSEVKLPFYSDKGDACMDVCANKEMTIEPHTTVIVPTGIKAIIPGGYELQIRPRSGLSKNSGLRLPNTPGTIDSGYRKEIGILVENTSDTPFEIKKYDRIAQLKLSEVPHIVWEETTEEDFNKFATNRGEGFGSSGIATNV